MPPNYFRKMFFATSWFNEFNNGAGDRRSIIVVAVGTVSIWLRPKRQSWNETKDGDVSLQE
jgi:hypothetical protein